MTVARQAMGRGSFNLLKLILIPNRLFYTFNLNI